MENYKSNNLFKFLEILDFKKIIFKFLTFFLKVSIIFIRLYRILI